MLPRILWPNTLPRARRSHYRGCLKLTRRSGSKPEGSLPSTVRSCDWGQLTGTAQCSSSAIFDCSVLNFHKKAYFRSIGQHNPTCSIVKGRKISPVISSVQLNLRHTESNLKLLASANLFLVVINSQTYTPTAGSCKLNCRPPCAESANSTLPPYIPAVSKIIDMPRPDPGLLSSSR